MPKATLIRIPRYDDLHRASIEILNEDIEAGNVVAFEGLAPRELISQFRALIMHYNRCVSRLGHKLYSED